MSRVRKVPEGECLDRAGFLIFLILEVFVKKFNHQKEVSLKIARRWGFQKKNPASTYFHSTLRYNYRRR